ncbi:uncharacterized protein LOC113212826 [Frankliniella occidentalis]|uniref:Uncharacterized protein LOC113212826 n=1 Tax=Frankliniella occidentalis TaxID=133901 RepID=A0A6J1T2F4_FRAOC|nr:uncharacterized protein LOC113212826 [Frankliniella occidentalis]
MNSPEHEVLVLLPVTLLVLLAVCSEPAAGDDAPHTLQKRSSPPRSPARSPPKSPPKQWTQPPLTLQESLNGPWFLKPQGPMQKPVKGGKWIWGIVPVKNRKPNSGGAGPSGKKSPPSGKRGK